MTQVFSIPDFKESRIPQPEMFRALANHIRRDIENSTIFVAAKFFGSYVYGFDCTSDLDILIIYKSKNTEKAIEMMAEWEGVANAWYIPLNIIPISIGPSKIARDLPFGLALYKSIHDCGSQHVIKNDPLQFITEPTRPIVEETLEYLWRKMQKITILRTKTRVLENTESPEAMELTSEVLQLPTHIARRILHIRSIEMENDSKPIVRKHYSERFPENKAQFDYLLQIKDAYVDLCMDQISGDRTAHFRYGSMINNLIPKFGAQVLQEFLEANLALAEITMRDR